MTTENYREDQETMQDRPVWMGGSMDRQGRYKYRALGARD